jgi:hypothetical protein
MAARSHLRGHEIERIGDEWVYSSDKTPTVGNERDCGFCDKGNTPEGHDGCLGTLPGVKNACCGHGRSDEAYVQFEKGSDLRGVDAHVWIANEAY